MKKLAFIGTGNMAGAIIRAVSKMMTDPGEICVTNRTAQKAMDIAWKCGCIFAPDNCSAAKGAKYIVLGVKPNMIRRVIKEIAPVITEDQVIVSMAAGVTGETISRALGKDNPVIRIIPNTPCAIGRGLMLLAPCGYVDSAVVDELAALLSGCGYVGITDEDHADAAMVVGGCTPAFTYMFIEALSDGAVMAGLTRNDAIKWAAQAVMGAAALVMEGELHPAQLKDAVCSPGGATIEGVKALEEGAMRAAAMNAVIAAFDKTAELGK